MSLTKRFIYKLFSNMIQMTGGLIQIMIIPQAIGPAAYGSFTFLVQFFQNIFSMLNGGINEAFFTKISRDNNDKGLILYFSCLILLLFSLIGAFILISINLGLQPFFWPDQSSLNIFLGYSTAFLILSNTIVLVIADAYAVTSINEIIRICHKIIMILSLVVLWKWYSLNLHTVFFYHIFFLAGLTLFSTMLFIKKGIFKNIFKAINIKHYTKSFYTYCSPLVVNTVICNACLMLDIWLLQYFCGSIQQGLYGFSVKVSALAILFTTSAVPLLTRDFSKAFGEKNSAIMKKLLPQSLKLFYALSATICCFMIIFAKPIIILFAGKSFESAFIPFILMCLYPIHQTYGQINQSCLYATDQTKVTRNIGVSSSVVGLILTYIFLAPKSMFGLDLNASGLALKMFIINIVSVNAMLYYNARLLKFKITPLLTHQVFNLVPIFSIGGIVYIIYGYLVSLGILLSLLISGVIYMLLIGSVAYMFPFVFGIEVKTFLNRIFKGKSKEIKL